MQTLNRVLKGPPTAVMAAEQLGLSVQRRRRVLAAYRAQEAAAIPHRNRAQPPADTAASVVCDRVVELRRTSHAGTDDRHSRDLLEEREGLARSVSMVRRVRRAAEEASPRIGNAGSGGPRKGCRCNWAVATTIGWTAGTHA